MTNSNYYSYMYQVIKYSDLQDRSSRTISSIMREAITILNSQDKKKYDDLIIRSYLVVVLRKLIERRNGQKKRKPFKRVIAAEKRKE